jgi:hypothetical protein
VPAAPQAWQGWQRSSTKSTMTRSMIFAPRAGAPFSRPGVVADGMQTEILCRKHSGDCGSGLVDVLGKESERERDSRPLAAFQSGMYFNISTSVLAISCMRPGERHSRATVHLRVVVVIAWFSCGSMPDIPSVGEQYSNAASYARSKGLQVEGDQETFGKRLTEVCRF